MVFDFFKTARSKGNLGVDIGTSSIKVVELEKKGGRFSLANYAIFEMTGSGVSTKSNEAWASILKLPDQEIAVGIKEVIKKANITSVDAVVSIPSFSTFATVISMPYVTNEDLARAIPFEAKKYVPIPLDEVILEWSIVGVSNGDTTKGGKPATVDVFLAAVPKDETVRYQNIMKAGGLKLKALELENSALIRALLGNDLSPTVIVNIGGRSTSIIIANRGYERLSHNYEVGGFEITKAIAQSLNINLEKAEELKRKFGIKKGEDNVITESMISLIDMMVFETQKTISNYEEAKGEKILNVILIGGLANMPGLLEYFTEKLKRGVTLGNPFSRIIYPPELESLTAELSSIFSVAIGLAMREV